MEKAEKIEEELRKRMLVNSHAAYQGVPFEYFSRRGLELIVLEIGGALANSGLGVSMNDHSLVCELTNIPEIAEPKRTRLDDIAEDVRNEEFKYAYKRVSFENIDLLLRTADSYLEHYPQLCEEFNHKIEGCNCDGCRVYRELREEVE
jgi:hypothetical protein